MPDTHVPQCPSRPLLWVATGRQRVGKTALLNAAVQYFRAAGSEIAVWNADEQNRTHSLSTFFPDAEVPPSGGLADTRAWIEERLAHQAAGGYHAVLDAGGGFTGFSSLLDDVPVVEALGAQGVNVVGLFVVGPEQADLDYLQHFADSGKFLPKASAIVFNGGLVLSGRSPNAAFAPVIASKAVQQGVVRGARVVQMPALTCMAAVTDRGLTFADAAEGRVKPGQAPMSMFDPIRVREWWMKKVPAFFDQFPREWLPLPTPHAAERLSAEREPA